jgi:glycosyltransferase involved in cell wall biosynthesis
MVSNFSSNNIYECRSNCPKSVSNKLNLVGVGNFSDSHGYDLVMESIHIWNNDINKPFKVYLTLVGSGEYEKFLKLKSKQLEIESFVNFMGYLNYNEYKEIYCLSHIAVGSIASFRKNLKFHSPLKEREYTFVGIPFISSINDIGFINDCEFRYVIEADSPIQGLLNLYNNIDKFISIPPALISNYASAYFTFDNFYSQIKKKAQSDIFQ